MKTVLRKRHYCDFCGKSGGHAGCMRKHESRCTLNPNRQCGLCQLIDQVPVSPKELAGLAFSCSSEQAVLNEKVIREKCHNCPACILAVVRQAYKSMGLEDAMQMVEIKFDFKEELKKFWQDHNDARNGHNY